MNSQILTTERLVLRPYSLSDVESLVRLAGAREVAATTLRIPHPYTEQDARNFIATYQASAGDEARFAITLRTDGQFCGGTGLRLDAAHHHAELGYWLGVPFWGQGYATEASRALVDWAFTQDTEELFAVARPNNTRAIATAKRIGMQWVGETTKYYDLRLQVYRVRHSDLL